MKVALVHDWIIGLRGGEKCLQHFLGIYPDADIFTLFHTPGTTTKQIDLRIKQVSWLNKMPAAKRLYRHMLPLYPLATRSFNLSGYDLVISLSHAAAKNVKVPAAIPHLCYCFTPMRYIWDQSHEYFGHATMFLQPILALLRAWDRSASARVNSFAAISRFVAARIRCFYHRNATIVYPPVDIEKISVRKEGQRGEAFLCAGALVPYKRVDVAVRVCSELGERLWVVGAGPELERLRRIAGPSVEFLGRISDEQLSDRYRRCRALLFPGVEDFGMVPVECLAAGRPVIGLAAGALPEILGLATPNLKQLEHSQAAGIAYRLEGSMEASLQKALLDFVAREDEFSASSCVARARLFSPSIFAKSISEMIEQLVVNRALVRAGQPERRQALC